MKKNRFSDNRSVLDANHRMRNIALRPKTIALLTFAVVVVGMMSPRTRVDIFTRFMASFVRRASRGNVDELTRFFVSQPILVDDVAHLFGLRIYPVERIDLARIVHQLFLLGERLVEILLVRINQQKTPSAVWHLDAADREMQIDVPPQTGVAHDHEDVGLRVIRINGIELRRGLADDAGQRMRGGVFPVLFADFT